MSATAHASETLAVGKPARKLLDELSRLYSLVLLTDSRGRVLGLSGAWLEACEDSSAGVGSDLRSFIPRMPRPEQSFTILSRLRERGFLFSSSVELPEGASDQSPLDVTIFPLKPAATQPGVNVVIARRGEARPARDSLLDDHPDAILAVDSQGFVTHANRAAGSLIGTSPEELEGAAVVALAADPGGVLALLDAVGGSEPAEFELRLRTPASRRPRVGVVATPRQRSQASGSGMLLTLRRPDSAKQAVAALMRRNDELEHCINTLAHDLRSPLVALLGFSRLLRQDYGERLDDTGKHFVDRIEQAGRTMEALIHDLLELSRIGQPGEHPSLVDPRTVLLQLVAEFKPRLDADGISIEVPEDAPLVYCDRTRLYQVFSNLIGNALEHMGCCKDRRIVVSFREDEAEHRITVRDFGRGVDPEHHERIFQAFQSMESRSDGSRGTGMGLAIVRKIAELRGGRAWVESRTGAGAAFHVTLPRR